MFIILTAAHEPRVATLRVHYLLLPTLHVDVVKLIFSLASFILLAHLSLLVSDVV